VVWVTRSKEVYDNLQTWGYEVYMMHSIKSIYYHFKAGVYIICNIPFYVSGYDGDTMGQFAGHAVKINTWHGIPIKAGKSTGENVKKSGMTGNMKYVLRHSKVVKNIFSPGNWDHAYYLSTGEKCNRACSEFVGIGLEQFIESGYPRNCIETDFTEAENKVIYQIKSCKKSILYAPTFREKGEVPHPLEDVSFQDFLKDNQILWLEKPHSASHVENFETRRKESNILYLPATFDINVVLKYVTLTITDYSSVCFDAVATGTPVLFYAPDYEFYQSKERGFILDYKMFAGKELSLSIQELQNQIDDFFGETMKHDSVLDRMADIRREFFDVSEFSHQYVIDEIINKTGIWKEE
jgi:CDP-glycerol glycerophosphotransferase (TagB/SpsB family)